MQKIQTSKFIFSKQAKRLPEIIPLDEELAYILGLWKADRCSTAKGIVGLRSKDKILLENFQQFIQRIGLEVKKRTVNGYGKTDEVYCCSMPLRRIFEFVSNSRLKLLNTKTLQLAYISGVIDGDGTIVADKGDMIMRIFYEKKDIQDALMDKKLLTNVGVNTTFTESKTRDLIILTVRRVSKTGKLFLPFLKLPRKIEKLKFCHAA
jgi:intein/homing endonuclease